MGAAPLQVAGVHLARDPGEEAAGACRSSLLARAISALHSLGTDSSPYRAPTIAPLIVAIESQSRP